ncbi:hypothetical protein HG535_0E04090 [Zygotorulaspora mrakii]|uniref:Methionyl-tRNA formyltransferase, mitochondrial n=1 Tax=Zygotorulaspora mrakii TaxID=42260 RepID=A0A7H9B3T6_ZYGMR|nr:uncharacterized protein HG535_0E04090 [Zygotorulaspora mrakii]QLG73325.1 hypothetical protein HG535_0E04090 [Zygotorulaspora mrakii]
MKIGVLRLKGRRWFSHRPLNILFFGSDEFSMHSFRALDSLRKTSTMIGKLQLVSRPAKWCGRQKSQLKYPPIVTANQKLGSPLPLSCETSQDWANLRDIVENDNYNMIVAVSFGKLISQELLRHVKYSLNVHPSLLPRYKGASPIQYALLNRDEFTGVTVQTLDPLKFDHGTIVAQTEPLKIKDLLSKGTINQFDKETPLKTAILMDQLGLEGASLLVKVILDRSYENPLKIISSYDPSYASKISSRDKQVDWSNESAESIVNKLQTVGPLYTHKEVQTKNNEVTLKRIIFHSFSAVPEGLLIPQVLEAPGDFVYSKEDQCLYVRCGKNSCITIHDLQFEGFKVENANQFITSLRKRCGAAMCQNQKFTTQN